MLPRTFHQLQRFPFLRVQVLRAAAPVPATCSLSNGIREGVVRVFLAVLLEDAAFGGEHFLVEIFAGVVGLRWGFEEDYVGGGLAEGVDC